MKNNLYEREWAYDKVLDWAMRHADSEIELDRRRSKERAEGKLQSDRISEYLTNQNICTEILTQTRRYIEILKAAKPVVVGPATLDSLVNQRPDSYDCLVHNKLPFDFVFFEFLEPIDFSLHESLNTLNFKWPKSSPVGAMFYKTKNLQFKGDTSIISDSNYTIEFFCPHDDSTFFMHNIKFDPNERGIFRYIPFGGYIKNHFLIDFNSGRVEVPYPNPAIKDSDPLSEIFIHKTSSLVDLESELKITPEPFYKMANLCTNLVNYINAHNVTLTRKDRFRRNYWNVQRGKPGKKKPFYIVTIRDEEREVPERNPDAEPKWTLNERIYVRGHDRRYRDESGQICRTKWISPYVKGPIDAPWRNQRYQLLADKLEKEKQFQRQLLSQ